MVADHSVVNERLKLLNEYVSDLRDLQDVDFETYQHNKLIRRTVERTLHLAIEACLDIGQHVIAGEGYRTPTDNRDVFAVLGDEGLLDQALTQRLQNMASFRNLIVHEYARIDDAIVFGVLKRRLGDLELFARAIVTFLEGN